ncbi:beta-carotene 15,15'-monooxygenase [Pedobacter hiemivivus]|uniref:Beta-carotene 15,15'-monooxygenase n=1 Tax=Pedobacter hiemivivus TaxID=2530454 RepID=A0A4R0N6R3_9SPHI|nr:beta-carotene 15,15'-monooxygenase [Pedobacter hiemivivus]TCC95751.1 beta-carotene 15,15'-monooxygenase [Pedobacter hiemivivus]
MSSLKENITWTKTEIFLFRLSFVFFIVLSIPFNKLVFHHIGTKVWSFQSFYQLATFQTSFIPENPVAGINLSGYYNWLIALIIALIATLIWQKLSPSKKAYPQLYYWLRVFLRYRLALAIIATGIVKLFPIQLPLPTLSDLHTAYGDFLPWKVYFLSTSVSSAYYVVSLGLLEIAAGLLLIYHRTVAIGAGLATALLLNIVLVNFAYGIGNQVYSSFLLLIALFILSYDLRRIFNLFFLEVQSLADNFVPNYHPLIKKYRKYLQLTFLLILFVFGLATYFSWTSTKYPYPENKGLANTEGIYDVSKFVLNNDTIPYSLTSPNRWQNVVFEKWNTISIRDNKPVKIDSLRPEITYQASKERNFEELGNGGRHFYSYQTAADSNQIILENKTDVTDGYTFALTRQGDQEITLKGFNKTGDSLSVVLTRVAKTYLLKEGRRKPIKIY